jgi:hypothetical protein
MKGMKKFLWSNGKYQYNQEKPGVYVPKLFHFAEAKLQFNFFIAMTFYLFESCVTNIQRRNKIV